MGIENNTIMSRRAWVSEAKNTNIVIQFSYFGHIESKKEYWHGHWPRVARISDWSQPHAWLWTHNTFKDYIPEPRLESKNLDEDALRKYEALPPALQKVFREKEEFHWEFQEQFGLATTADEIIWWQLNEMHPLA